MQPLACKSGNITLSPITEALNSQIVAANYKQTFQANLFSVYSLHNLWNMTAHFTES